MMVGGDCPGPLSRRSFLEAGSLLLGGLSLGDLFRLRAAAAQETSRPEPDTSVILIWLQGGPSHMETYDLKPEAPIEYRGDFQPISTAVSGMDICEHLPLHAKVADRFTLIRSISHGFANHAAGAGRFLSGRKPRRRLDPISQYPTIGPIVETVCQPRRKRDVRHAEISRVGIRADNKRQTGFTEIGCSSAVDPRLIADVIRQSRVPVLADFRDNRTNRGVLGNRVE